jgi:L-ascorbate metabolism protein UlaG (beta-lactamase superfamily)
MRAALLVSLSLAACTHAAAPAPSSPAAAPAPSPPKTAVTMTYLGVAGWQISDGQHVILVDPYFSRPDLDQPLVPDEAAIAAHAPAHADLILIGHSHSDHVLDAPSVARRTGAAILGTESTTRLAHAAGIPDEQLIPVKGGEDYPACTRRSATSTSSVGPA